MTVAVADFVGSATLVAVIVTCCCVLMEAGAVYIAVSGPALVIVPRFGLIDQVAACWILSGYLSRRQSQAEGKGPLPEAST